MNDNFKKILELIPLEKGVSVDWSAFEASELSIVLSQMASTMQNTEYHGEGDVYSHTKGVCESLIGFDSYHSLDTEKKQILFLAALLHDIGKIRCTKLEGGKLVSPHHCAVGAIMARELLWRTFGLSGNDKDQQFREAVCSLIRYHSFPTHVIADDDCDYKILKTASVGDNVKSFSIDLLCILERADVLGRISNDHESCIEKIELCNILASELGCASEPYPFPSAHSKRAFMLKRTKWKDQELFDDTWGKVILLSGLPGTGKDTWIRENYPNLPVISLDEIRKELGISPTDNQGRVISEGHERARALLRQKTPFIWNATNISSQIRSTQIALFEQYGASVTTVFLETEWEEGLRRNSERRAAVPPAVIERLLSKLEMPESFECTSVIYKTV